MKKYKLIKEYPSSPKLDTIGYITNNCTAYCLDHSTSYSSEIIDFKKYKEYWQEIAEKDYEILSFRQWTHNGTYLIAIKVSSDPILFSGGNVFGCSEAWLLESGKELDIEIYSVKRLSS